MWLTLGAIVIVAGVGLLGFAVIHWMLEEPSQNSPVAVNILPETSGGAGAAEASHDVAPAHAPAAPQATEKPQPNLIFQKISDTIQNDVGRQLKAAGATYDDLQVTAPQQVNSNWVFTVNYTGLSGFQSVNGAVFNNATGSFPLTPLDAHTWHGTLAGTQFTVSARTTDDINLSFVDDPDVIGQWTSVDFVSDKSDFDPSHKSFKGDLFCKGLTFLDGGKTPQSWVMWTKGVVMHQGEKTASHYEIQQINGRPYLFFEWRGGDVTLLGMKPSYYVMRKN
jgi:bla regulator protein BlaR1